MASQDSLLLEMASSANSISTAEFLSKKLLYVPDNSNGNYQINQLHYDTVQICNNGMSMDYANGFISIPLVVQCDFGATANALTVNDTKKERTLFRFYSCI